MKSIVPDYKLVTRVQNNHPVYLAANSTSTNVQSHASRTYHIYVQLLT